MGGHEVHTTRAIKRRTVGLVFAIALLGAATILTTASAGTEACGVCGKNLIKNPGAEGGLGITSVGASGAVPNATNAAATIGKQTIALPAAAVGKKATLSGWLGNYVNNRAQVRAEFADAAGSVLLRIRIGPDTTIASTDMAFRTRSGKVPAGAKQVTIVVTFAGGGVAYKLAGADALSLVLS